MRPLWAWLLGITGALALILFGLYIVDGYGFLGQGIPGGIGRLLSFRLHTDPALRAAAVATYLLHGILGVEVLARRFGHRGPFPLFIRVLGWGILGYVAWVAVWAEIAG